MPIQHLNDSSSGVTIGESPMPGLRLRHVCRGHGGRVTRVAWSPCGNFLASPSFDKTVRIWEAQNGSLIQVLNGSRRLMTVAWSPDSKQIAAGGDEERIRIWDVSTGALDAKIPLGYLVDTVSLAWAPDRSVLAAVGTSGCIKLYETNFWREVNRLGSERDRMIELAWSPDGKKLGAVGIENRPVIWDTRDWVQITHMPRRSTASRSAFSSLAWSHDSTRIYVACDDLTVAIYHLRDSPVIRSEGHTGRIKSISLSFDGLVVASKGAVNDNMIRFWSAESLLPLGTVRESSSNSWRQGIAFSPKKALLATLGDQETAIRLWDFDTSKLLRSEDKGSVVNIISAKIVLVGESNVGKSCLAMQLAEKRYPSEAERGTTHGMRLWSMDAETLHPSIKGTPQQNREVIMWDLGGQSEYRLIHQLFLHDSSIALILIDPTRGEVAFNEAREWNKRIERQLAQRDTVKILVGAQMDQESGLVSNALINDLCAECGFVNYCETSALNGRGIEDLRQKIAGTMDWDNLAKTNRPELFHFIRTEIETRRKAKDVVLLVETLKHLVLQSHPKLYDEASVQSVVDQLAAQGLIARTQLRAGEDTIVLQLPVIESYAGSLILAARNNPRGIPALDESLLGSSHLPLPGIKVEERLERLQEKIVLECVSELMIQHGICFRHEGLLIFPSLFPRAAEQRSEKLEHSVSLYYDFTGAIDNIYASLVTRLAVSQAFGDARLWPNRVEYHQSSKGLCGIRQIKRAGGLAHLDLFFSEETSAERRQLFTRFVEDHLNAFGIEIREHQSIQCRECEFEITQDIVEENIARGKTDVICPICRTLTRVSQGVETIRQQDTDSDRKIIALRKVIAGRLAKDAEKTKQTVSEDKDKRSDDIIRILHLSDLHFTSKTVWESKLHWLLQDLMHGDDMPRKQINYVVVSGDMTDKGRPEGFELAREFVSRLREHLGISIYHFIFVPGNHDVHAPADSYDVRENADGLDKGQWVQEGKIFLARNEEKFLLRFKRYSDDFFHKLYQTPYPSDFLNQGISYLFEDEKIQFLTLNSCWEIDYFHRNLSSVHPGAVAKVIAEADLQIDDAVKRGALGNRSDVLRISVWHHAVAHASGMNDTSFIDHMKIASVKLALHGDIHELNTERISYFHHHHLDVIGGGSFGAPHQGLPEGTPRHYNLLEIKRKINASDFDSVRVHTRQQRKPEGAWEGWYVWPNAYGQGRLPYFDIDLK